jgi:hypothetical protein
MYQFSIVYNEFRRFLHPGILEHFYFDRLLDDVLHGGVMLHFGLRGTDRHNQIVSGMIVSLLVPGTLPPPT